MSWLAWLFSMWLAAPNAAVVTYAQGQVNVKLRQQVMVGQVVTTGKNGRATLAFADGTQLRVGPNSSLTVTRNRQTGGSWETFVQSTVGRLYSKVVPGRGRFAVKGPRAVAAVTGTIFSVDSQPDLTGIINYEGGVGIHRPTEDESALEESLKLLPMPAPRPGWPPTEVPPPVHEVPPPVRVVPGPTEVPMDQWLEIVQNQRIQVGLDGHSVVSEIDPQQLAAQDEWIRWNREQDRLK